jgi:pyruvate formate lyase activating enzyme
LRDRLTEALKFMRNTRNRWRRSIDFPTSIPRGGKKCFLCINECEIPIGGMGYCGILRNEDGRLVPVTKSFKEAYLRWYLDPHPTNCVALPVCPEKDHSGKLKDGECMSLEEFVRIADQRRISCVCYFGGDPLPWSTFTLKVSRKTKKRICWETNGLMNESVSRQMASISLETGGIIMHDLPTTSKEQMKRVFESARSKGLKRIFIENVWLLS